MEVRRSAPGRRSLLAAFQVGETAFVDLGDAGERADILAVLAGGFFEIGDVPGPSIEGAEPVALHAGHEFDRLHQGLQPLIDVHVFSVTPTRKSPGDYNGTMFFRREAPRNPSFPERIEALQSAGFTAAPRPDGAVRMARSGIAVELEENKAEVRRASRAGIVVGDEIAALTDIGYQKIFRTPSGKDLPATAAQLCAIHEFEEDLKEGFGLVSLYNESLGTVSTFYLYDRVKDRDRGVGRRVWETQPAE
jgi:hypothetical protein